MYSLLSRLRMSGTSFIRLGNDQGCVVQSSGASTSDSPVFEVNSPDSGCHRSEVDAVSCSDNSYCGSPCKDVEKDTYYAVEKFVDVASGRTPSRRRWLVKWRGYGTKHNTWESESDLIYCKALIAATAKRWDLPPPSNPILVSGSNLRSELVPPNIDNWVTLSFVRDVLQIYRSAPQYDKVLPVELLETNDLTVPPVQDVLYLLTFESHIYVAYCFCSRKFALVSDGLGLSSIDRRVKRRLAIQLKLKVRSVDCRLQKRVDYCGASAVAICLEMLRQIRTDTDVLEEPISFPAKTFQSIIRRMHKFPSSSLSGWKPIGSLSTRKYCDVCKVFSVPLNADPRRMQQHKRVKCN